MAKTKRELDVYTIRGTNKIVRAGDCVLMRSSETDTPPYVARVEKIEADNKSEMKVRVRWYYRPEESIGGRRQFHGSKELFLSDHYDTQSAHTIEGKCIVHSFKDYSKLEDVGVEDYYCRFEYKAATGAFMPDHVAVYCKCEMPYNPDDLMIQCDGCKDWYHPACLEMSIDQAKILDHFVCAECSEYDTKKSQEAVSASPLTNGMISSLFALFFPTNAETKKQLATRNATTQDSDGTVVRVGSDNSDTGGVQTPEDMNAFGGVVM